MITKESNEPLATQSATAWGDYTIHTKSPTLRDIFIHLNCSLA